MEEEDRQCRKNHCVGTLALLALADQWDRKAEMYFKECGYSGNAHISGAMFGLAAGIREAASTIRGIVNEIEEEEGCG